jgi:excisionase family DNA binding protein
MIGFARMLRALRERKGLTQEEAAVYLGFPLDAYQRWEAGEKKPPVFDALQDQLEALDDAEAVAMAPHRYLSVKDYAAMHGRSPVTIRDMIKRGRIPAEKVGRDYIIPEDLPYPEDARVVTGQYIGDHPVRRKKEDTKDDPDAV